MSRLYTSAQRRFSFLSRSMLMAAALFGTTQIAMAAPTQTVDQLSACLVKATTATDKTAVLQWTFAALSTHPDLKSFSNVTDVQKEQLDKLGSITGEEIIKNPEVKQQLKGVVRYLDLNKLVMTFLTPDLFNKLGVIR